MLSRSNDQIAPRRREPGVGGRRTWPGLKRREVDKDGTCQRERSVAATQLPTSEEQRNFWARITALEHQTWVLLPDA